MITHILLLLFFVNLITGSLFAAHGVNKLPSEPPPQLGSYMQSSLPQLNIDYDMAPNVNRSEYSQPLQNYGPESFIYCPHTEILTKILNELRRVLPQDSNKIKDILSNYYVLLHNALNSRDSVESLNKLTSKSHFNYIDSLAQKLILMGEQNVKMKISFEYEMPSMSKTKCDKLCNDLIQFANAGNSAQINNLNNAKEPIVNHNIMNLLQNYRPDNIYSNFPYNLKIRNKFPLINYQDYVNPPNLFNRPTNIMPPNIPISNPSQPISHFTRTTTSGSLQDYVPLPTSPTDNNIFSKQNISPPLINDIGNSNFISSQNVAALLQESDIKDSNISKYLPPLPNLPKILNSYALNNLAYQHPSTEGPLDSAIYSKQYGLLQSIGAAKDYPNQNFHVMPKEPSNIHPLSILAPPLTNPKNTGNIKLLKKAVPEPQNLTGPQDYYPIQNASPQIQKLTENAEDIEEFAKKLIKQYHSNENSQNHHKTQLQQMQYNTGNAMQFLGKNNPTIVPKTKYDNPGLNMVPNSWTHQAQLNNEKLINLYKQSNPSMSSLLLEKTTLYPPNLYHNLNTNALSNIKQHENGKLLTNSLLAQVNSLNYYNEYLQSLKNLLYQQTNPGTGYFVNRQIPYSSLNFDPFSYENNNALYKTYLKNINQLLTHSYIPNKPVLYPYSYYYNPNLGITNNAKNTQENYSDQFKDLHRLLAVSNLNKLNSMSNKNGIVELTYKLNHSKPLVEPSYYVKYKLPYDLFLFNLKKLLTETPNLKNDPHKLYRDLLINSNITASSSELRSMNKEDLLRLVSTNGTLVTAKVLDVNDNTANEQIKILQNLNAKMPLQDIVRTDASITKVANLTSNIPIMNYSPNYLNDLQRKMVNSNYFNPYNTQANQNYNLNVQNPNFLLNKMVENKHLQIKKNDPYSSYGINSLSRYRGYTG